MISFIDDILDLLLESHAEIEKEVKELPGEALDWIPGSGMNSISVLVVHLVGAERYWIGVAGDQPPARDREAEFKTTGMSANDLLSILSAGNDFARMHLSRMQLSDLQVIPAIPSQFQIVFPWLVPGTCLGTYCITYRSYPVDPSIMGPEENFLI